MHLICVAVSFLASVIGCICGIGGGVIIKPALDMVGLYPVDTVSFLSGCIVLAMTAYSVIRSQLAHESVIEMGISTWLGIGAALGGLAGKHLFHLVTGWFADVDRIGAIQAALLFAATFGTAVYLKYKKSIHTRKVKNPLSCMSIGFVLGLLSAFLGIGGGPFNLVVLSYFFSMESKQAAQNSLYIILLSQLASICLTIGSGNIPDISGKMVAGMMLCGTLGGVAGREINKKMNAARVERLFMGMLIVIMGICGYNFYTLAGIS